MKGLIWRILSSIFDWRLIIRKIKGQNEIDVVFITNIRDNIDKDRFLKNWIPPKGHFNGPRYYLLNSKISGRTRAIYSTTEDLAYSESRLLAKQQFKSALEWANRKGARVVLFAAGTKRLFSRDQMDEMKEKYSNILFTIGDNGTVYILMEETKRALINSSLPNTKKTRIAVLGAYGFLGKMMIHFLNSSGYYVIGVGSSESRLKNISEEYNIETVKTIHDLGKVDAVVACTHSNAVRLTADNIAEIRKNNRKLLVIDVSEPSNLTEEEYEKCKKFVIRQDAGNAFNPKLKYVLGSLTYKKFRLYKGVTFGCFAEALALAAFIDTDSSIKNYDWLEVNDQNIAKISDLFNKLNFTLPEPYCFNNPVSNFNLYSFI